MKIKSLLVVTMAVCTLTGCATTYRLPRVQFEALPPIPPEKKLPLSVTLVLNKDLANYGFQVKCIGGDEMYLIGEWLQQYSWDVCNSAFTRVDVFNSVAAAANKADITIVPKVVRSNYIVIGKIDCLLVVEWEVKDRAGHTVWLTSIDSEVEITSFSKRADRIAPIKTLIEQLRRKTLAALMESAELKRLVPQTK